MKKAKLEKFVQGIGMKPERRAKFRGWDIMVADGFVSPATNLRKHYEKRGAVDKDEFLFGFFVSTSIICHDDEAFMGPVCFFEALHDTGMDTPTKQVARLNSAQKAAETIINDIHNGALNA